MPGIKSAIKDILQKLSEIPVSNEDNSEVQPYVRVWNNQLTYLREGVIESFPLPAFLLEILNSTRYQVIGQGYRDADVTFRVHILHGHLNDSIGATYEQDLLVFDLRDKVLAHLTFFTASGCGPLTAIVEEQDYSHDNIYHYTIDFVCNFTDSKSSRLDDDRNYYTQSEPPTDVEIDADFNLNTQPQNSQQPFLFPPKS